jgi:hypothetical protein
MFMLVVVALVSVFGYLGSYGIGTEISCIFYCFQRSGTRDKTGSVLRNERHLFHFTSRKKV